MSNEEQVSRDSGHEPGPVRPDGPAVVHPDEVVLDDADISAGTLEPELSVSPDTLGLAEPALGPARISSDVAEAASLEEAAAEARAVAAEAEKAGTLVGGPMPADAPVTGAAPDGTAPAGGPAGETHHDDDGAASTEVPAATASDDGNDAGPISRDAAARTDVAPQHGNEPIAPDPEAPTGASGAAAVGSVSPGEPGLGYASQHPGTDPADVGPGNAGSPSEPSLDPGGNATAASAARVPTAPETDAVAGAHPTRDRTHAQSSTVPLLLVIGGVVVLLGLLVWLISSLFGGQPDEGRVNPSSLAAACPTDFTGITEEARLVDCTEPRFAVVENGDTATRSLLDT